MTWPKSLLAILLAPSLLTVLTQQRPARAAEAFAKVGHRRALLIGVNEYKHFRRLSYCGTDVRALGKRLVTAGFDANKVVVIHDEATRSLQPDKEKIVNQITLLLESAQPKDLVFLAFNGHGVRIQGKSYLVPYEGEAPKSESAADVEAALRTMISLDWVYDKLRACPASMKLFLVDACQNRLFEGDQRSVGRGQVDQLSESLETAPKGVLLLTACAPGEVSHEAQTFGHGVYTYYLLEALEGRADFNHDGIISLKEANLYTSTHTEKFVRTHFSATQRPSFRGELEGDVPLAECLLMDRITVPDEIEQLDVALRRAAEGATITVKPGLYRYSRALEITRDVTIVGASGDARDVVLESSGASAVVMKAPRARIQNLSLRNTATDASAVWVPQGRLEMLKCDVTSQMGAGVYARGETTHALLSFCNIHDAARQGVCFGEKSQGIVHNCEIYANAFPGVGVAKGANPTLKGCKIHDGKSNGVYVYDQGAGTFEDCEIYGNASPGVGVAKGANPTLKGCKIHDGKSNGVYVYDQGAGTFEDCEIHGNALAGVAVSKGGNPTVKGCKMHDGKSNGVWVYDQGAGTFEGCEIYGNAKPGVAVGDGGNPIVKRCTIRDGKSVGVLVCNKGWGTLENCDVYGNAHVGVEGAVKSQMQRFSP